MTEQELLALYKQRGQRTVQETEAVHGRYLSKVAGAVFSLQEDVKECPSDTRFRAWDSIPPRKPKRFCTYLSRIIKNLTFSLSRKQHAEKRYSEQYQPALDELDESMLLTDEGTEEAADENRLAAYIDRFLERLPKTRRILFVRHYFYTDPTQEITLRRGMSESTIKVSLYRIHKNLVFVLRKGGFPRGVRASWRRLPISRRVG